MGIYDIHDSIDKKHKMKEYRYFFHDKKDSLRLKQTLKHRLESTKQFVLFVIAHFIEDDCTYRASALAYTSLLAIVPLMTVSLVVLSSFPVFQDLREPIQNFIFENFVPATGKVVQGYLLQFTNQVSHLSFFGVIFLFITALLLMYTIEGSMNRIWRVRTPRRGVSAVLLYWAILSLAPLFLGFSVAASSYVFSMPFIRGYHPPSVFVSFLPFVFSLIGFTFLYVVVPNCSVKLKHGLYGALITTVLFESAKQAFAIYLGQYNTYKLLYGAFATIPLFFIWIYWVWLITLMGAEISYALSVHYQRRTGSPLDGFSHALIWLQCLWQAQVEGKSVSLETLIDASEQPFVVNVGEMLSNLTELNLIKATQDDNYVLSRDLSHLTLYELLQLLPYPLPKRNDIDNTKDAGLKKWYQPIQRAHQGLQENLDGNLDRLFRMEK